MSLKPLAAFSIAALGALALAGCGSDTIVGPSGTAGLDLQRMELRDTSSRRLSEGEAPPQVLQWFKEQYPKGKITGIDFMIGAEFHREPALVCVRLAHQQQSFVIKHASQELHKHQTGRAGAADEN